MLVICTCWRLQVCTLRKRMYANNVRNCSQKDTAVASAAPK